MEMLGNGRIFFFMVKTVVHSRLFSSQTISPLATWLDEQMESSLGMFWGLDIYVCSGEQENLGSKCAVCFLSLLNPTLGSFHKAFSLKLYLMERVRKRVRQYPGEVLSV